MSIKTAGFTLLTADFLATGDGATAIKITVLGCELRNVNFGIGATNTGDEEWLD